MAQEGLFTAQDYLMLASSAAMSTATMTHGFSGKGFGGWNSIGAYMSGIQPDIQMMRKITGQTWPSRQYARMAAKSPTLRALAPTLGALGPSKYLTYWSALAGNERAIQSLAGMAMAKDVGSSARAAGMTAKQIFGTPDYTFKGALRNRNSMFTRFSNLTGDATWGQFTGEGSAIGKLLRAQQLKAMQAGASTAEKAAAGATIGRLSGVFDGKIGGLAGGLINRGMASGGATGTLFKAGGRMIPGASRFLGGVTAGVDLYTIGTMGGSLMGKGFIASLELPSKMYMGMTAGLHRGTFMSSSPLSPFVGATGRQRAMANIYDRQLNLRQVLGNEAALLSGY